MTNSAPAWKDQGEGRRYYSLPVTDILSGSLKLPLHVSEGRRDGPTLGITTTIHGDETLPAMIVRKALEGIDTGELCGRVCVITVCNPLAMADFDRQTPEQHGKTDLHEVFPGSRGGNLTQKMARTIVDGLLDHVDAHIDYHCGGSGGRLQERVDFHRGAEEPLKSSSLELARAFGTTMIHENNLTGSAVHYVNSRGKAAFNAETSGVYLGPEATGYYVDKAVAGLYSVMRALGMLPGEPAVTPGQIRFGTDHRVEVNPMRGGYLESRFQSASEIGTHVEKGTKLGEIIDMFSLDVVEELTAPVSGYLFFSRYSGVVDAGTKAFALAGDAGSELLE